MVTSPQPMASPTWVRTIFVAAVALAVVVGILGIFPVRSQTQSLVVSRTEESIPLDDPWAAIWETTTPETVALSAQNIAPPFGGGAVSAVAARALHDGQRLYFLVEWDDDSADSSVTGAELFSDAAALQFPINGAEAPYTMGGAGLPVNIWQWKAVWQADIESGFETIQDRLPNTYVDDYQNPDDPLYLTAESVGNPLAQRDRMSPVENLVAEGFGTLTTSEIQDVDGAGVWNDGQWRALFVRDFVAADPELTSFAIGKVTQVAFAVWDGNAGDRNGQKSITTFVDLQLVDETAPMPGEGSVRSDLLLLLLTITLAAIAVYGITRGIKEENE